MADVGIGCVYTPSPLATPAPPAAPAVQPRQAKRRARKVTPEVSAFIRSSRHLEMADILDQVQQRFGVQLARGTVYKEWQSTHLPVPPGSPRPHPQVLSGSGN